MLLAPLACPVLRHESERRRRTSAAGTSSKEDDYKFFGPASLAFEMGSKSVQNIYFEIEFCGFNTEAFDIKALQDIQVGIHGTKGHANAVWTVSWDAKALETRLGFSFSEMTV
jgi:hypothetical protein